MNRIRLTAPILLAGLVLVSVVYAAGSVGGVRELDQRRMDRAKEIHANEVEKAAADFLKRIERANATLERAYEPIIRNYEKSDAEVAERLRTELAGVCEDALTLAANGPAAARRHVALIESIGDSLVSGRGRTVAAAELAKRDYVLLYYTAEWCHPCRQFTPTLVKFYNDHQQKGNFEVVVVSSDRTQEAFSSYIRTMPWLAVPYGRRDACGLKQQYGRNAIPHLVLLDAEGNVVSSTGTGLSRDKLLADFERLIASKNAG